VLQVAFATKALREICENEAVAKMKLGLKAAAALKRRLSDFQSIESFDELPIAAPKPTSNARGFPLADAWRLVVTAAHSENPTLAFGKIDWTQVSRVKITKIEKE
jgi:hypothetical protein